MLLIEKVDDLMPPKFKFTKEQIINVAFDITKNEGIECLTARYLAKNLGVSSKIVFGHFNGMNDLINEVIIKARLLYNEYVQIGFKEKIKFKGLGIQYIKFAKEQPKLFQLLFMNQSTKISHYSNIIPLINTNFNEIIHSMNIDFSINEETSKKLFNHLFIYTHGIASMFANNICDYSEEKIEELITEIFTVLYNKYKGEELS